MYIQCSPAAGVMFLFSGWPTWTSLKAWPTWSSSSPGLQLHWYRQLYTCTQEKDLKIVVLHDCTVLYDSTFLVTFLWSRHAVISSKIILIFFDLYRLSLWIHFWIYSYMDEPPFSRVNIYVCATFQTYSSVLNLAFDHRGLYMYCAASPRTEYQSMENAKETGKRENI